MPRMYPGSLRRSNVNDYCLEPELSGDGPDTRQWLQMVVDRHRIGDAELIPVSRYRSSRNVTPEGDLASPQEP